MRLAAAGLAMLCLAAAAADAYESGGHEYSLTCAADGFVLKSRYPITRTIGTGAGSRQVSRRETLYLGRSCDAYVKHLGTGSWCWANGGFTATFGETSVGFGRQELSCPTPRDYDTNCRC